MASPGDHTPAGDQRRPRMGSPVVHFDISGPNPEELQQFYSELFGWKLNVIPEMNYALVDTQGGFGINGGIGGSHDGPRPDAVARVDGRPPATAANHPAHPG